MSPRAVVETYNLTWTSTIYGTDGIPSTFAIVSTDTAVTWSDGITVTTITGYGPFSLPLFSETLTRTSQPHGKHSHDSGTATAGQLNTTTGSETPQVSTSSFLPASSQNQAPSTASSSRSHVEGPLISASAANPASTASGHTGPSSATLAGAAIGCAVAGAMIASIAACILMRRRRRTASSLHRAVSMTEELHPNGGDAPETMEMALAKINTDSTVDDLLPAPVSERDLANAMRSLGTAVKNHAHSYYGSGDALSISSGSAQLSFLLGPRSPVTVKALLPLLSNPLYKVKSIRFLIARSVLHDANTTSSLDRTLLPPDLARCVTAMDVQQNEASQCALLSKWRQMTAALMQSAFDSSEVSQYDSRQSNIRELTEALNAVLEPLASTRTNVERRQDLENLVKKAARLIYMIFTLPTTWEFDWHHPDNKSRELVVFPALRQTSDDQGRARVSFQALTQPQVASMGKSNLQAS